MKSLHYNFAFLLLFLIVFQAPAQRTYSYGYNSTGDRVYKLGDQQKSGSGDSTRIFSFSDTSTIIKQQTTLSSGEAVQAHISLPTALLISVTIKIFLRIGLLQHCMVLRLEQLQADCWLINLVITYGGGMLLNMAEISGLL